MENKKKIVLLGVGHPFRGGLASYNERLVREYKSQGCDVVLSTFTLQYPNILFPGKTQYSSSEKPADIDIVEEVNSINPINWIKVGRRIKKEAPDLLLFKFWIPFMGPCFGTIARIVKRNKKTKVITIIDNIIPHEKRLGDRLLSNYFVGAVDGFVAMSKRVLEDLNSFDSTKPKRFSPHPIFDNFGASINRTEALEAIGLSPDYQYILFFGFIRDYKGLDLLIDAFSDSRFRTMKLKLIVAGEFYNDGNQYFEQIKALGLEQDIVMRNDFIPNDTVKHYFCASNIIAQPYKTATQSGVTQIAYHFEKPMLVTNVGGLAEIIPHNVVGYAVEPKPKAIADALVDFFEQNKQETFEQNMESEKKKYSWSKMIDTIEDVYDEI
ncbi:MAG: glycosyltransferase [Flavobacteriales bacterium]